MSDSFQTIGLYLPSTVVEELDSFVYQKAGIVDLREYEYEDGLQISADDPLGKCLDPIFEEVVNSFASLYSSAEFDDAKQINAEELELLMLPIREDLLYPFREKVNATSVLQECDTRTVHTAMFTVVVDHGLLTDENN